MTVIAHNYGNLPIYRFYISEAGSTTYEVYPLNFLSTTLTDQKESEQVFYRRSFSGTLIFGSNSPVLDWDDGVTIHNRQEDWYLFNGFRQHDPCAKLFFHIHRSDMIDPYWEGYFSVTDGKFDLDRCTFEVTPLANDDYADILEAQDTQINILAIPIGDAPVITTKIYGTTHQFTRNRFLLDVIKYMADEMVAGVTISSTFLTAANNPATLHTNHLLYLTIAQKSDIIRPTSTDASTIAMLSWKELMDIMWTMFQVRWDYISGTNTINVEHISFWSQVAGLDLTTQLISQTTNKFSYIKEEMPKSERFSFMESFNGNFVGTPIWYDSNCIDQNPESNSRETSIPVTTELEYIMSNPADIADDGFVILCNYLSGGLYYIESDYGSLVVGSALNMHLSVANLQNFYHRHNRVLINGKLNNNDVTFWTAQKNKLQECYAIVNPDDLFDPANYIHTELGNTYFNSHATVKSATLKPSSEMKLNLVYGDADTPFTGVDDVKVITVTEITGNHQSRFNFTLNKDADDDLVITIYLTCKDIDGVECDTAVETITIASGTRNDFCLIPWCEPVATPAICVAHYVTDITDATAHGWTVTFSYDPDSYCP
jgi:hypothetical protein